MLFLLEMMEGKSQMVSMTMLFCGSCLLTALKKHHTARHATQNIINSLHLAHIYETSEEWNVQTGARLHGLHIIL